LDEPLVEFLESLPQNATVMLFADHGFHMGGLGAVVGSWEYYLEAILPAMIMTQPILDEESLQHLEVNQ